MPKENNIKEELLKQMEKDSGNASERNTKSLEQIIAKDIARVKRLRWVTVISWVLVALCFMATAFLERAMYARALLDTEEAWLNSLIVILKALLLTAVIFAILLYTWARTLTIHRIQARLANIEAMLKQMSRDK